MQGASCKQWNSRPPGSSDQKPQSAPVLNRLHAAVALAASLLTSYGRSAGQEIPHILQKPKIHRHDPKSPLPDHTPTQINPANTLPNHLFNVHVSTEDPIYI
jgi:hypothetical protein